MSNDQIYCNQCGTVNECQFHYCLTCGHPIGELLYSPHEPKTKAPTLNNINWDEANIHQFIKKGNLDAERGGKLF